MIDTLILSGGGTNAISILGCMKYLLDNNHIKKLKNIVCVSASMFLVILILLDFSVDFLIELFLTLDYNLIDKNDFKINNLLKDYGFYESDYIHNVLIEIFNKKNISENITLKELYEISNCRLIVKVSNLSKQSLEYIDHINTPDIPIITLTKMTMSIPFIFKPIIYKDNFYVDGGLTGNFPIDFLKKLKTKNYFGINIKKVKKEEEINNIIDYLLVFFKHPLSSLDEKKTSKKRMNLICNNGLIDGIIKTPTKEEKKELINYAISKTEEHFREFYE